jgi:predicted RNA binding protein YcfA (HicA-like mRNA interferase family)
MKLPTDLSGAAVRKALEKVGFVFQRQKGSHMILRRETPYSRVVVPDHRRVRPVRFGRFCTKRV